MLDSVELHQIQITPSDLPFKLALAAEGNPQTDYHALRGDGVGWFTDLWALIRLDSEWVSLVRKTLTEFLTKGTAVRCQFAITVASIAPEALDPASILNAFSRKDIDDSAREAIATQTNRSILASHLPYTPALRPWIASPSTKNNLLASCWVFDHAWCLAQLPSLLPPDPREAAFDTAIALAQLRRSEWDQAALDIEAARPELGDPRTDAILSRLSRSQATVDWAAPHRQGPVRWVTSPPVGPSP